MACLSNPETQKYERSPNNNILIVETIKPLSNPSIPKNDNFSTMRLSDGKTRVAQKAAISSIINNPAKMPIINIAVSINSLLNLFKSISSFNDSGEDSIVCAVEVEDEVEEVCDVVLTSVSYLPCANEIQEKQVKYKVNKRLITIGVLSRA